MLYYLFFSFSAKEKNQKKTRRCIFFIHFFLEITTISVISTHPFRATLWYRCFNSIHSKKIPGDMNASNIDFDKNKLFSIIYHSNLVQRLILTFVFQT